MKGEPNRVLYEIQGLWRNPLFLQADTVTAKGTPPSHSSLEEGKKMNFDHVASQEAYSTSNIPFSFELRYSCRFRLHSVPPSSASCNLLGAESSFFYLRFNFYNTLTKLRDGSCRSILDSRRQATYISVPQEGPPITMGRTFLYCTAASFPPGGWMASAHPEPFPECSCERSA